MRVTNSSRQSAAHNWEGEQLAIDESEPVVAGLRGVAVFALERGPRFPAVRFIATGQNSAPRLVSGGRVPSVSYFFRALR